MKDCGMTFRQVEVWLTHLEESMKECVRGHLSDAVRAHEERPREQWILDFPAQVALTGSQIWWNNDMELVFRRLEEGFESALKDYNKKQVCFPRLSTLPGIMCTWFYRTKITTKNSLKSSQLVSSTEGHIFILKKPESKISCILRIYILNRKAKNPIRYTVVKVVGTKQTCSFCFLFPCATQ